MAQLQTVHHSLRAAQAATLALLEVLEPQAKLVRRQTCFVVLVRAAVVGFFQVRAVLAALPMELPLPAAAEVARAAEVALSGYKVPIWSLGAAQEAAQTWRVQLARASPAPAPVRPVMAVAVGAQLADLLLAQRMLGQLAEMQLR